MDEFKSIIRVANEILNSNEVSQSREPDKSMSGANERSASMDDFFQFADNPSQQDSGSSAEKSIDHSRMQVMLSPNSSKSIMEPQRPISPGGKISQQALSNAVQIIQKQVQQKRIKSKLSSMLRAESYDNLRVHP